MIWKWLRKRVARKQRHNEMVKDAEYVIKHWRDNWGMNGMAPGLGTAERSMCRLMSSLVLSLTELKRVRGR